MKQERTTTSIHFTSLLVGVRQVQTLVALPFIPTAALRIYDNRSFGPLHKKFIIKKTIIDLQLDL